MDSKLFGGCYQIVPGRIFALSVNLNFEPHHGNIYLKVEHLLPSIMFFYTTGCKKALHDFLGNVSIKYFVLQ